KNNESFLGEVKGIPEWLVSQVNNDQVDMGRKEIKTVNFNMVVCKLVLRLISLVRQYFDQEIEGQSDLTISLVKVEHTENDKSVLKNIRMFFHSSNGSHNNKN